MLYALRIVAEIILIGVGLCSQVSASGERDRHIPSRMKPHHTPFPFVTSDTRTESRPATVTREAAL